jgi:hypothetical protein
MYAIVRTSTFDMQKLERAEEQIHEFDEIHASQPGYRGELVVDAREGRMIVLNLWDSEAQAKAAFEVMGAAAERLLRPLMTRPGEIVGAGPVVKERSQLPTTVA